jgi:LmbE family N-acetylglucosaminyl deacetylase
MTFKTPGSQLFIPDGAPTEEALARTTYMGVAAHQDDLEIMSFHGIIDCFQRDDKWFAGVIVTNGAGSPRADVYGTFSDADMIEVRAKEQKKAAYVGEYAFQALLHWPSANIKDPADQEPIEELRALLEASQPERIYTHNLADKHDTHVAVTIKVIEACRRLAPEHRPREVWGCEVWRDLDWMSDPDKVVLDCSAHENLQASLLGVFDSQVCGGKRYDLATLGRRRAHATYHESHGVDVSQMLNFGMDLTPLINDPTLKPSDFVHSYLQRFWDEISARIGKVGG